MTRIIVDLTEDQIKEIEKMIGKGAYKTRSELIRDAVRRLIKEEKKEARILSNGGEAEF